MFLLSGRYVTCSLYGLWLVSAMIRNNVTTLRIELTDFHPEAYVVLDTPLLV